MFVNEGAIRRQNEVLKTLLKRIGSNLLSGKSIMSISLPVTIFDPFTELERIAIRGALAGHFLSQAASAEPARRLALACVYNITKLNIGLGGEKPFNPILGETFQCEIGGLQYFAEQVSHHPPVSAFLMLG